MLDIFFERLKQKKRTVPYPKALPPLPPRFRGRPFIDSGRCAACSGSAGFAGSGTTGSGASGSGTTGSGATAFAQGESCGLCASACPTNAIRMEHGIPALDMGYCTFCGHCARACPHEALVFTTDWRLASTDRDALVIRPQTYESVAPAQSTSGASSSPVTQSLPERPERTFQLPELPIIATNRAAGAFARSFKLRQVTAAGCGACEADINVLTTVVFDIARFGMDIVASPRHADGMALTGPLPVNMVTGFEKCRTAMAAPKHILAIGTCAISGGLFGSSRNANQEAPGSAPTHSVNSGDHASRVTNAPVTVSKTMAEGASPHCTPDLYIPGCPPHPYTELDGLLRFLGQKVPNP